MLFNYIIGPAGSGKTTLVGALYNYLSEKYNELSIININLDPGVTILPYPPHIDIRDYISLDEVMTKYGLGPNGGLIAATDLIIDYLDEIKYEISQYSDPDLVLIDTPGQMELFAFRSTGPIVASSLGFGDVQKAITFLFDPTIAKIPNGFISTTLLAASVQYRFLNIPQLNILSKSDSIPLEITEKIIRWSTDYEDLQNSTDAVERGLLRELNVMISQIFSKLSTIPELLPLSAKTNEGIDDYWAALTRALNFDESPYY
ncbi:MAG: ATP/GTP-binding protein [Promethearchaeota archaeon]